MIYIDASTYGVGSALYQPDNLGDALNQKNLVAFKSHALKQYQQHYANSPFKLELWALKQALRDYRDYIWGRSFIVYTDHQALVNINSKS